MDAGGTAERRGEQAQGSIRRGTAVEQGATGDRGGLSRRGARRLGAALELVARAVGNVARRVGRQLGLGRELVGERFAIELAVVDRFRSPRLGRSRLLIGGLPCSRSSRLIGPESASDLTVPEPSAALPTRTAPEAIAAPSASAMATPNTDDSAHITSPWSAPAKRFRASCRAGRRRSRR